jgi:hypothetical protein
MFHPTAWPKTGVNVAHFIMNRQQTRPQRFEHHKEHDKGLKGLKESFVQDKSCGRVTLVIESAARIRSRSKKAIQIHIMDDGLTAISHTGRRSSTKPPHIPDYPR